jgi:arabinan endo-1,5-alpha-L-arabinosidase
LLTSTLTIAMATLLQPTLLSATPTPSEKDGWSVFPGDGASASQSGHVHDPTIVEIGSKRFCFSTSGDGFTVVRESTDWSHWKTLGPIFSVEPKWLSERYDHKSIWAPDVLVLGKTVRVYYCKSNFGTNKSVIGLAENASFDPNRPLEGWVDKGLVYESKPGADKNAIDAETIIDEQGRHWMFFGSYWSGIHVVELDAQSGFLKNPSSPAITCVAKNTGERGNPLEGAAVLKRGDYYYLFVSYGLAAQGVRSTYRIMVGRSKSAQGPFVDAAGKSMAEGGFVNVMKTSPPMMSPGHCDVLTLKDGRTVMPYHFYDARQAWNGDNWGLPTLQVRELLWTKDGWPVPGLPLEAARPAPGTSIIGRWTHQVDFGQPETIDLNSDGSIIEVTDGSRTKRGEWESQNGEIIFTWTKDRRGRPIGPFQDRVNTAYQNGYYAGRTGAGAVVRGYRVSVME